MSSAIWLANARSLGDGGDGVANLFVLQVPALSPARVFDADEIGDAVLHAPNGEEVRLVFVLK